MLLLTLISIGGPADLTGAWTLIREWTDAPSRVYTGGRDHVVEHVLEPQDNIVIMQREAAVMIVEDNGHHEQFSTLGAAEHHCWKSGCVSIQTRWNGGTLRQTFALGNNAWLEQTFARPAHDRLTVTITLALRISVGPDAWLAACSGWLMRSPL